MKWFLAGDSVTLHEEFVIDGVPREPDVDSVKFTLRGNSGLTVAPHVNETLTPRGTGVDIVISGADNTPATAGDLETRFITVSFTVEGRPYTISDSYRLTPFIPMTCTPETVRGHLGMTLEELQDQEVDLIQAYYDLQPKVPSLETYLTSSGVKALKANDAIAIQAALIIAASLPNRLAAQQKSADAQFNRLSKIDPRQLVEDLLQLQGDIIDYLTNSGATTVTITPIFLVSTRTDPVTGA